MRGKGRQNQSLFKWKCWRRKRHREGNKTKKRRVGDGEPAASVAVAAASWR